MTRTEETLFLSLQYAQMQELPPKETPKTRFWKYAIGKIITKNGGLVYAILRHDAYGINVFKSFGAITIGKILAVYPYSLVEKERLPAKCTVDELKKIVADAYDILPESMDECTDEQVTDLFMGYIHAQDKHAKDTQQNTGIDYDTRRH